MSPAFSNIVACRYSPEQLLHLRTTLPMVSCVVSKLNRHPDIARLLNLPDEALKDPERFTCKSKTLLDVSNNSKHQLGRRIGGSGSSESDNLIASSVNLPRETHRIQWQLRRRESSDRAGQPHPAPSGVVAQQSENFQRFYRAVVSPTHVRVTAGGRIVPNNRAPPLFEWNKVKFAFEQPKTEQNPLPTTYPQLLPSGLLATHTTMASQSLSTIGFDKENGQPMDRFDDGPQPIKLSHPSQFDQTKPFLYNGHVVYPLPAGLQLPPNALPVPFTVLGNPNFTPKVPPTPNFMPQQLPIPIGLLAPPPMLPPTSQQILQSSNMASTAECIPQLAPYPSQSGILSVSDLTKFQIQGFYSHLKFIDNQIANNKHQIDENYMMHQRGEVVAAMAKMEAMLQAQLGHDGRASTKLHQIDDVDVHSDSHRAAGNLIYRASERSSAGCSLPRDEQENCLSQGIFSKPKQVPVTLSAPHGSTRQADKTEHSKMAAGSRNMKLTTQSEPVIKSKLTAAAAMAPPFQPRVQTIKTSNTYVTYPSSDVELTTTQTQLPIQIQSHYPASLDQPNNDISVTGTNYASFSRVHSVHKGPILSQDESLPTAFERSQKFHGIPGALSASSMTSIIPPKAVPYLIGVLPRGVDASQAKGTDLVYSRPLTEEEIRARYLYWGKAPRAVQSGLPKFDGKDFYPPSPGKEISHRKSASLTARGDFDGSSLVVKDYLPSPAKGYPASPAVDEGLSLQNTSMISTQERGGNSFIDLQPSLTQPIYRYGSKPPSKFPIAYQSSEQADYKPVSPDVHGDALVLLNEDFSQLFLERGVPGYKSPTPPSQSSSNLHEGSDVPVTPTNRRQYGTRGVNYNETRPLDSWGAPENYTSRSLEDTEPITPRELEQNGSLSDGSTVEINLTRIKEDFPKHEIGDGASGRATDLTNADHQSLFLQSMLRNSTQATMAAPALSGMVSSATAQGYLPQYHGAAAASLAPAALNVTATDQNTERHSMKMDLSSGIAPLIAANFLPENRPLNRDRPESGTTGAEGYMRYISQKANEDQKIINQGWNANTTATGPVMGSDW